MSGPSFGTRQGMIVFVIVVLEVRGASWATEICKDKNQLEKDQGLPEDWGRRWTSA